MSDDIRVFFARFRVLKKHHDRLRTLTQGMESKAGTSNKPQAVAGQQIVNETTHVSESESEEGVPSPSGPLTSTPKDPADEDRKISVSPNISPINND